jgi:hypothetical protein
VAEKEGGGYFLRSRHGTELILARVMLAPFAYVLFIMMNSDK